jgi:hypothetical protein
MYSRPTWNSVGFLDLLLYLSMEAQRLGWLS